MLKESRISPKDNCGLRLSSDFAKALAGGVDAIAIGTSEWLLEHPL